MRIFPLKNTISPSLTEEIFGLQYALRGLFVIAVPLLIFFTIYNVTLNNIVEAVLTGAMALLLLISHFRAKSTAFLAYTPKRQYEIYQRIFRGFILLFLIHIIYALAYQHDMNKINWSYILPLFISSSLARREAILWSGFLVIIMACILFYPRPEILSDFTFGFKIRYLATMAILSAAGIAWKTGVRYTYNLLADQKQKLVESEGKYRLIFENSVDVIYFMDKDFRLIDISPSVEKSLGYTPQELIGKNIQELGLLAPESMEQAFSDALSVLNGAPISSAFYTFLAKDNTKRYGEVSGASIKRNGEIVGLISVARDITDRKVAEEEKRKSTELLHSVVNNAQDVIWMTDMDIHFIFVSPAIKQMLGYTIEEFLEKPLSEIFVPSSLDLMFKTLAEELADEKNPQIARTRFRILETEQIQKNGTHVWVELKMNFIHDGKGKAVGILGFSRNITDRKQLELEKQQMQERLHQAERLESLGVLAGGIAHNFNNLLGVINGYASLALLDTEPSHPNFEKLRRIEKEVENGTRLTRELLGFARGGKYEIRPTNINETIKKTASIFEKTRKEISFQWEFGKDIWIVEVDQTQMEQVFINLYLNAWQAIGEDGGSISLATENVFVDDKQTTSLCITPGKYVKITVKDTGRGMDEKTKGRIFEPFFTTKKIGTASGLGLATVYGIIKNHHGAINVESSPGQGTTFHIYLPASDKELPKHHIAPATAISPGRETILIVDDEKMLLEVNQELLKSLGYSVYAAGSGQEAIAIYMAKKDQIDLVILDMVMPGLSGSETLAHLQKINPDIKVLLSTGYSINGQAQELLKCGCCGFLQKPFHLKELSRKVTETLKFNQSSTA